MNEYFYNTNTVLLALVLIDAEYLPMSGGALEARFCFASVMDRIIQDKIIQLETGASEAISQPLGGRG